MGVKKRILVGTDGSEHAQRAVRWAADLVVVGSRGAGGFSDLHLGSTSHQVALYADRPVTIIPPPGRNLPIG